MGLANDAYDAVEVDVPDGPVPVEVSGRTLRLRCLTVSEGHRFMRLLQSMASTGGAEGELDIILDEFPALVGIEDERLTPLEVVEVLRRFLGARRTAPVAVAASPNP